MTLREELKDFTGKKRLFLLLRIADMETPAARGLCGITASQYDHWCNNRQFVALHRKREELSALYKQEAIQLLRRNNQLAAVLLEGKMLKKIDAELDSGSYDFIRTNLAREVYSKLIADLDVLPKVVGLSWEQRINHIISSTPTSEVVEGQARQLEVGSADPEADSSEAEQHTESNTLEGSE